ncbi:MAG: TolC family protein, partial [Bacteroidota bacterium]
LGLWLPTVLHISIAGAQTTSAKRFTLEDAVRSALRNNHDLASARHEVGRAEARLREAWGYAMPSIDLSGKYSRSIKKPVFFFPNIFDSAASKRGEVTAIEIGSDNAFDLNLTVSQVLFNSAVFTGVGTAKVYSQAALEVFRAKEVETIANARKAFYGVLLAAEVGEMLRSNLKNAEENFKNASILTEQGLLSEYDKLRAEVGLANVRPEVIRAESNYELAVNSLKIAMGVPFDQEIEIGGTLGFTPVDDGILKHATATVLENNPSLAALRYQQDVNDAVTAVERSNYLPSLAAFGNYQFQTQKNDLRISTRDFVNSSIVGISLSMNIFNGFRTAARVEQAELDARKTQEQIASMENSLKTAVQSTLMSLKRAKERIEAQQRTVEQAGKGYRIATTRFTSGSGTQLEVNDAQLALTTAKTNRIQAIYDYLVASAELDQLLGHKPEYV